MPNSAGAARVPMVCLNCEKGFLTFPWRAVGPSRAKFCSVLCAARYRARQSSLKARAKHGTTTCEHCGITIQKMGGYDTPTRKRAWRHCSDLCRRLAWQAYQDQNRGKRVKKLSWGP